MVERSSAVMLIIAFFTLILGVSLLVTIGEQEQGLVTKEAVLNESDDFSACRVEETINDTGCNFTVTNAPTGWKLDDTSNACPLTNFVLKNCTGHTLTITTDYVVDLATGIYELKNNSDVLCGNTTGDRYPYALVNKTFVYYNYCPDDYLTQSWQRSIMDVVVGMFAIALLAISVGIFYAVLKREGLTGI